MRARPKASYYELCESSERQRGDRFRGRYGLDGSAVVVSQD